ALAVQAREENNPEKLVALLGACLHPVQDFYSHTNWVEPLPFHGVPGADGPGWSERGYGSNPTWFDIPADVRDEFKIYAADTSDREVGPTLSPSREGHFNHRAQGDWDADGNTSLKNARAKDWQGRPLFDKADETAFFPSRQWIEGLQALVTD